MLRSAGAMGVLVVLLLAAAPAARAGDGFPDPGFDVDELAGPAAQRAGHIVERAQEATRRRWPRCTREAEPPSPAPAGPAVPVEATAALGVLRRAQTPAEAALVTGTPEELGFRAANVVPTSLRVLRVLPDGERLLLYVGIGEPRVRVPLLSPVCRARETREVRRRTRGQPREVRRWVRRFERDQAALDRHRATPPGTGAHVHLASMPAEHADLVGTEAVVVPLERVASRGAVIAVRRRRHTLVLVAVPDGVARVEVILARGRSPYSDRLYRRVLRASGAVVDNLAAIPVGRPAVDGVVVRQRWLAPDGRLVADIDCPEAGC